MLLRMTRAALEARGEPVARGLLCPTHTSALQRKMGPTNRRDVAHGRHRVAMCRAAAADLGEGWIETFDGLALAPKNMGAARARAVIEAAFPASEVVGVMGVDSHEIAARVAKRGQRVALAVNRDLERVGELDLDGWAGANPSALVVWPPEGERVPAMSATAVRECARAGGAGLDELVSPGVAAYMAAHELYQGPEPAPAPAPPAAEPEPTELDFPHVELAWRELCPEGCHEDPWEHVHARQALGSGRQGRVFADELHGRPVAVKAFNLRGKKRREGRLAAGAFRRELRALSMLTGHPHVVACHGGAVLEGGRFAFVVLELADGPLQPRCSGGPGGVWALADDAQWWLEQLAGLADALGVAADLGVLHRDLSVDNVLVAAGGRRLCLSDFGVSQLVGEPRSIRGNMPRYAPEAARSDERAEYTSAADCFMFGVLLFEVAHGGPAFAPPEGPLGKRGVIERTARGERPEPAVAAPRAFWDVVEACWAQSPADRPAFPEVARRLRRVATELAAPVPYAAQPTLEMEAGHGGVVAAGEMALWRCCACVVS